MDKRTQQQLYKKYPTLFKQHTWSIEESAMPWGVDFETGWAKLLDELCSKLVKVSPNAEFSQVKEKLGSARFYADNITKAGYDLISEYETKSAYICEQCGAKGKIYNHNGWLKCRCKKCAIKEGIQISK